MRSLIEEIEKLKTRPVAEVIERRLQEFKELGTRSSREIYKELCFCTLTANYSAEGGIRIQKEIGDDFCHLGHEGLSKRLKELGYRFPNKRAEYICCHNQYKDSIKEVITGIDDDKERRDWIVKNIKGIGIKEASHFLRNIGYGNYAIVDFHIVDLLAEHGLVKRPKTMTPKAYLHIEGVLKDLGKEVGLNMAELDLYLWYIETGKVLK